MLSKATKADKIWFFLFLGLPFLYFFLYGSYGFADTDQGFVQGLSWRILEGEIPHWSFFYVRPALSPVLHALELAVLPENYAILLSRLIFWLMLWASVAFALLSLHRFQPIKKTTGLTFGFIGAFAFVLTAHNYPPMPWHTVDGVFFASLGIYLIIRRETLLSLSAALLVLCLAAACKQPFFIVPFLGIGLIWALYGARKGILALAFLIGTASLFFMGLYLLSADLLGAMQQQIFGESKVADLFEAGIKVYLKPLILWVLPLVIGIWAAKRWKKEALILPALPYVLLLFVGGMLALHAFFALQEQVSISPRYGYVHGLFLAASGVSVVALLQDKKVAFTLLALLGVAWASGISWGYQTPILFISPAVFALFWGLKTLAKQEIRFWMGPVLLGVALLSFFIMFRFPYGDGPRSGEQKHLGALYPRLSGIWTHVKTYGKYKDLHRLKQQYEGEFAVLPSMPLLHYLYDESPPLQVDWAHNAEMNWQQNRELILNKLNFIQPTIFLEKSRLHELGLEGKYGSALARYVKENWSMINESEHFEIYRP